MLERESGGCHTFRIPDSMGLYVPGPSQAQSSIGRPNQSGAQTTGRNVVKRSRC